LASSAQIDESLKNGERQGPRARVPSHWNGAEGEQRQELLLPSERNNKIVKTLTTA
jgi:hypothetical protein